MSQVRNSDPGVRHWPSEVPLSDRERMVRVTREGWRELGFWFDCDWQAERWSFRANRRGLAALVARLRDFAADRVDPEDDDHVHLGPYASLRLAHGERASLDRRGFTGQRDDFETLARELERLAAAGTAVPREFARAFTGADGFDAVMTVEPDNFDPASADPAIAEEPES
jgi:hypothetical protein